jgi:hypothetical protein
MQQRFRLSACLICALALTANSSEPESTINPDHALGWSSNLGWVHWRPSGLDGARIGEFACSGFIYSANAGWVNLGNGAPANGIYYQNDTADDFGVNRDFEGNLRGLAYGANIGWIQFEAYGAPRVDWRTGRLEGAVYGANVGWIDLGNASFHIRTDSILPGRDSDGDGIPDAWKLLYGGDLEMLRGDLDADGNGATNLEEYLAGTNPFDPEDTFRIEGLQWSAELESYLLTFTTRPFRQYWITASPVLGPDAGWGEVGLGPLEGEHDVTVVLPADKDWSNHFFRVQAFRPLIRTGPHP